tara:strand:- start:1929 stop:2141 length:213 start_codon:yes stop_codon:yes gene_type:complete
MKVKVTYTEHLTYVHEKELEITKAEYKKLLDENSDFHIGLHQEMGSECCDEHWDCTESERLYIEPIETKK